MRELNLLIADGQELIREILTIFFKMERNFTVVGMAQDGLEAVLLCDKLEPEIALLDINMPTLNGNQAAQQIKAKHPGIKVILLTSTQKSDFVQSVNDYTIEGYLLKSLHPRILAHYIRLIHSGSIVLPQNNHPNITNNDSALPINISVG